MRSVEHGVNAGPEVDLNRLKANPVYETSDLAAIESLIDQARRNDGWLILYTHDVGPAPSPFGCSGSRFAAVLAAVRRSGLAVGTVGQASARLRPA